MDFSFYIAKRYLVSKKSRNVINIISWISVGSIAVGTFALVVVLSAFNGLEGLVESLFESFDADIRITATKGKTFNASQINFDEIEDLESVLNYTEVIEEVSGVKYKEAQAIVTLKGVEESFLQMSGMDSLLFDGEAILTDGEVNFAILGYGVAHTLSLYLSDINSQMTLFSPKRGKRHSMNLQSGFYRKMIIPSGIFYLSPEYDNQYIIVPLRFMKDFLNYGNEITSIEIQAKEGTDLQVLKDKIQNMVGSKLKVQNRYEYNAIIYKTNQTEKWITVLILLFILTIASFNILGSLTMLIIDKKNDIFILRSMGANTGLIKKIFFKEGMMINMLGAFTGIGLGLIVVWLQQTVGLLKLEGGIVPYYPVEVDYLEVLFIFATVLAIGFLASWYPVQRFTKSRI